MGWPGPVTYRQFRVWQWWDAMQLNSPDRLDYYIMKLAVILKNIHRKKQTAATSLEKEVIPFEIGHHRKPSSLSKADADAEAKAFLGAFAALFGGVSKIRGLPKSLGGDVDDTRPEDYFTGKPTEEKDAE